MFTSGILHIYDTQLFYQNLKDNAALRLQNYLQSHDQLSLLCEFAESLNLHGVF